MRFFVNSYELKRNHYHLLVETPAGTWLLG